MRPGGELVATVRSNPTTFNRLMSQQRTDDLIGLLTCAKLVRVNRATQEVEPWLAESWTRSSDARRFRLKLRQGVTFSDGHPFTADDVVFSFAAVYDEKAGSTLRDAVAVNGQPLRVTAIDAHTVDLEFPSPFGPGLRILDNLPILPRHKLEGALKDGSLATTWGLMTPPGELAGLGPFVLSEFVRGQRLVFTRNPRYWRKDAAGAPLPYLDRLTLAIVLDQDAEVLRFESGQSDMSVTEIRPSDYPTFKRLADERKIRLLDVGDAYDADGFWVNLRPNTFAGDPRASWLQRDELRRAISLAVDRKEFLNTVYFGSGTPVFGPITPANRRWYSAEVPQSPHDPSAAKSLLASIGLTDRNGDGVLEDARGTPARFELITQKGRTDRERGAAVIRDDLKKIGLTVDVVPLDFGDVVKRVYSGAYESMYFGAPATDTDPATNLDFWLSSGGQHFWNVGEKTPSTDWERRIDELMARQVSTTDEAERRRIFIDVQRVFAEHQPVVYFVAPHVFLATSARVANLTPAILPPQLLWSADTIAVVH